SQNNKEKSPSNAEHPQPPHSPLIWSHFQLQRQQFNMYKDLTHHFVQLHFDHLGVYPTFARDALTSSGTPILDLKLEAFMR
ncbi:MAG: hypothetical protein ACPLZY_00460, partial [Candidatus Norongarragalinales archaeon]